MYLLNCHLIILSFALTSFTLHYLLIYCQYQCLLIHLINFMITSFIYTLSVCLLMSFTANFTLAIFAIALLINPHWDLRLERSCQFYFYCLTWFSLFGDWSVCFSLDKTKSESHMHNLILIGSQMDLGSSFIVECM